MKFGSCYCCKHSGVDAFTEQYRCYRDERSRRVEKYDSCPDYEPDLLKTEIEV